MRKETVAFPAHSSKTWKHKWCEGNLIETDIFLSKMLVQHVGCLRKLIQHYPTWKRAKEMLDECFNWFKLSFNAFYEKNVGPTSSNIVRKRIQHFLSNMLNNPSKHSSWRRLSSCLQKKSSRRLDEDEYIVINHTSSEAVFKTSWSRPIYSFCPYIFKTFSRRLQDVSQIRLEDMLKTFWRRIIKVNCFC